MGECQIRNGWYAGWLISSIGGHPIYFVWYNTAPFCFLIIQIRPNITALYFHYSCITIVYLLPHAYKPNSCRRHNNQVDFFSCGDIPPMRATGLDNRGRRGCWSHVLLLSLSLTQVWSGGLGFLSWTFIKMIAYRIEPTFAFKGSQKTAKESRNIYRAHSLFGSHHCWHTGSTSSHIWTNRS